MSLTGVNFHGLSTRSRLYDLAGPETPIVMEDEPQLKPMPDKPTLIDYFNLRFAGSIHLLQSARKALLAGQREEVIMACLLHDIAVCGFIRGDHGYWGEQMIAPYVTEEISWAVRAHQALRFFPEPACAYEYPQAYVDYFGLDYKPDDYIVREYEAARKHEYYWTARMITVYDLYSFDPNVTVDIEDFTDIIGRHWRQPEEGLGFDNTSASHIWRTIRRPNKFL